MKYTTYFFLLILCFFYQDIQAQFFYNESKFEQLDPLLPTPNVYRTGSGSPGYAYWQQNADYDIKVTLNDEKQTIIGTETIQYTNNSPDALRYIWLQLDQNVRAKNSDTYKSKTSSLSDKNYKASLKYLNREVLENSFDGGFKITAVKNSKGEALNYTINKTMMRITLPKSLKKGETFGFQVDWHYNIHDRLAMGGRSGYEYFEEDKNYMYIIAQWFPRMAVYDDVNGWQHKQFLGRGEFALTFGDYKVAITVPSDHVVAATGILKNAEEILNIQALTQYKLAQKSTKPIVIVSQEEVEKKEKKHSKNQKTWIFEAKNVRDFAWTSSRKYIWDAMNVKIGSNNVLAMSLYPKEANPLWGKYSTEVVAHTLESYSYYTINYPYPTAISVHGKKIGMEYPMICFNPGRPDPDGTYSPAVKHRMISVVIHEIGHNFFPMIINSDERQWTWLDEGLNTFLQYLTEQSWDKNYPSRRGPAYKIIDYMRSEKDNMRPIMTNSESILQFGNNAYGKPSTALNILRETVMGRKLFDYAFKEYAKRWAFKHPNPADFFRTMEDASGIDLDWFWRGWFYTTDPVDLAISDVKEITLDTKEPQIKSKKLAKEEKEKRPYISDKRNQIAYKSIMELKPHLKDFYNEYDKYGVYPTDISNYQKYTSQMGKEDKEFIKTYKNKFFYELSFENKGGLVSPIILEMTFEDDTKAINYLPAEVWKLNDQIITKVFVTDKAVKQFSLDPYRETADINESNNHFPKKILSSRFELYKQKQNNKGQNRNYMREAKGKK